MPHYSSDQKFKQIDSSLDTRNPTTQKKVIFYTPLHKIKNPQIQGLKNGKSRPKSTQANMKRQKSKSNRNQKFRNSMYQKLQQQKLQCIRSSRYSQAKSINQKLRLIKQQRMKRVLTRLQKAYKYQKWQICHTHKAQMSRLQQAWQLTLLNQHVREQQALIRLKQLHQKDLQKGQRQIQKKSKFLKGNMAKIIELQHKQRYLLKLQDYDRLISLGGQKQLLNRRLYQQQKEKLSKLTLQMASSLNTMHDKRYSSLVDRFNEIRNNHQQYYSRESGRLKNKYQNVLRMLEHQHKRQIIQTQKGVKLIKN